MQEGKGYLLMVQRSKRVQRTAEEEEELYPARNEVPVKQHDERHRRKYQRRQKVGYLLKEIEPEQANKPKQETKHTNSSLLE